jgi:glycosyltransferase involved in cell wall biosynthesis
MNPVRGGGPRLSDSPNVLSIIIATYNASKYLPATLASIESQIPEALTRTEVIIIDGGSIDSTLSIAAASSCVAHIVSEPDDGIYDAMNKGAARASGDWLHFLNAGDTFHSENSLETLILALEQSGQEGALWAVGGAVNLNGGSGQIRLIPNMPHVWWAHAFGVQPHCHQATWFARRTFAAIGGHSLGFGIIGDFDLILRFGILAKPVEINATLVDYLGGGISEKSKKSVPALLHAVRVNRLNLSGRGAHFDGAITAGVAALNRGRIGLGSLRGRIRRLG